MNRLSVEVRRGEVPEVPSGIKNNRNVETVLAKEIAPLSRVDKYSPGIYFMLVALGVSATLIQSHFFSLNLIIRLPLS